MLSSGCGDGRCYRKPAAGELRLSADAMTPNPSANVWLRCPQPRPQARLRLFCFPYAGGGAAAYRTWPNHLPGDVEVCAIQLPGRDERLGETPYSDLVTLLEALAEGLAPRLEAPYAVFGHSLGALLAYELVRHQRRRGGNLPVHLFVSARRAPHVPSREPPCHLLPEQAFIQALVRRYNGIPQAILAEPAVMRLFLPVLRADFSVMETYRFVAEDPLDQAITAFGGLDDQVVSRADLETWRMTTRGECAIHMIPGGHFFLQTAPTALLDVIARQLVDGIDSGAATQR